MGSYEKKLIAQREENEETSMTIASYIENILNLCADYKETVGQKVNNAAQLLNQKKIDIANKENNDREEAAEMGHTDSDSLNENTKRYLIKDDENEKEQKEEDFFYWVGVFR